MADLAEGGAYVGRARQVDRVGRPGRIDEFEASLDAVTPETVKAAAQRYFDLENYVQVTLYPESMKGGGEGFRSAAIYPTNS